MKKDPTIREAIDESLCAVRFNAQDERNVMAAIHGRRVKAKKRARRLNLAFAAGLLLLLVLPVSAFTLHTRRLSAVNAAAPAKTVFSPRMPRRKRPPRVLRWPPQTPRHPGVLTEQDAIRPRGHALKRSATQAFSLSTNTPSPVSGRGTRIPC